MDCPVLRTGGSLALGVLALGAVHSGLTLAMAGGDSPPMGCAPVPDPAGGGVMSPPFPVNLTAKERANLETFDALDFEVFSNQDWARLGESPALHPRAFPPRALHRRHRHAHRRHDGLIPVGPGSAG